MAIKKDKISALDLANPLFQKGVRHGLRCAAEFAGTWDAQIDSKHRMEDIILCKFNLIDKRQLRKKKHEQNDHRGNAKSG